MTRQEDHDIRGEKKKKNQEREIEIDRDASPDKQDVAQHGKRRLLLRARPRTADAAKRDAKWCKMAWHDGASRWNTGSWSSSRSANLNSRHYLAAPSHDWSGRQGMHLQLPTASAAAWPDFN